MERLWQHQLDGIEYARDRQWSLFWVGMGAGKTRMTIEVIRDILSAARGARILVGCPKAVKAAWQKQMGLWMPGVRVLVLDKGTSKDKEAEVQAALADTSPLVVVGNYETLWRMPILEKLRWDVLVWDEVHRLKSPSGAASRWAARIGKKNPQAKRLGLSGTLLSQTPLDAYGVYRAVESPECATFGSSYTVFKNRFFQPHPHIKGAILGLRRDAEPEFSRLVRTTTFRRESKDVLDLPPIMFDDIAVELQPKEAKIYREVEREFCAVCETGTVTPANAMVAVLRLQQICGGYVTFDEQEQATRLEDTPAKQLALEDRLADMEVREPIVVFCRFKSDIASVRAAADRTGRTVSELSGRMNDLARWQAGDSDLLAAQIASGGIGVDMTRASYGFFYSLGFSLSDYEQAVARLHRPGQAKTTRFYHLVAVMPGNRKTVDGRVYEALSQRKDVIQNVITGYQASK